jgi:hypothetical protein
MNFNPVIDAFSSLGRTRLLWPGLRVCLLTTQDLDADPFPEDDWPCDPRPFLPEADWQVATLEKATSVEHVTKLIDEGNFDLFFNLCDGAADQDDVPGIEVVRTLEERNVPFTGATSEYYEPTREQMKQACRDSGINTPAYLFAGDELDVERAAATLRFPLFVKHYSSYAQLACGSRRGRSSLVMARLSSRNTSMAQSALCSSRRTPTILFVQEPTLQCSTASPRAKTSNIPP